MNSGLFPNERLAPEIVRSQFEQNGSHTQYLTSQFSSPEWREVVGNIRHAGVHQLLTVSENGMRGVAMTELANTLGINYIKLDGSERELRWDGYLEYLRLRNEQALSENVLSGKANFPEMPDVFEFQDWVARSKIAPVAYKMSDADWRRIGLAKSDDRFDREGDGSEGTLAVSFDTLIFVWDELKETYRAVEKPHSEDQAVQNILEFASGKPFLVSTFTRVQKLRNYRAFGRASAVIPMRILGSRFDRSALINEWISLYRKIAKGEGYPWKMTPAGPSLMHPRILPALGIAATQSLGGNIFPKNIEKVQRRLTPKGYRSVNLGDRAYLEWVEKMARETGYKSIENMEKETIQAIGVHCAGFSIAGLRAAIDDFSSRKITQRLSNHEDFILMGMMSC